MAIPDRAKVVLLDAGTISSGGLERVAQYASEVIVVGQRRRSGVVERLRALGVKVAVEEGKADIESAMRTAARRHAIVVVTGRPAKAKKLIQDAARGAANTVPLGLPAVGVILLGEHETRSGKVFAVTDTGEISGYELLFALGIAEHLGREVVMLAPSGRIKGPGAVVVSDAQRLAAEAGVEWTELSDPSPINSVIAQSGSAAGVIIGVLDLPSGPAWLGSRPKVNKGNANAAVCLIDEASCDVMVVFDGVQLTHETMSKDQAAAILGLSLVATGGAAAAITPASAMLGHVTRSITQQARTYRADIGSSDSDGPAGSSKSAQDSTDSHSRSGESPRGGSSTRTAAESSVSASTVHTSRSTPAPATSAAADRWGYDGHGAGGHSCDRGHNPHCDHPSHSTSGPASTSTPGTTPMTPQPEVKVPEPQRVPTPLATPHQVPTPTPQATPHQVPTPVATPHQVPTPTPQATPHQVPTPTVQQTPKPQQVPTSTLNPRQLTTDTDGTQVYHPRWEEKTPPPGWVSGTRTVVDNTGGTRTDVVWTRVAPKPIPTAVPQQVTHQVPTPTVQQTPKPQQVPTSTLNPRQITTDTDGTQVYHPRWEEKTPPPGWVTGTRTVVDNTGGTRTDVVWTRAPEQKVPTLTPQQVPTAVPPQVPTAVPGQVPQQVKTPDQVPGQVPGQVPTAVPGQVPQPVNTPQQVPTAVPPQVPTAVPGQVPQPVNTPQQVPTAVPPQVPTAVPGQVPQQVNTPQQVPGQVPGQVPTAVPGQVPQPVNTPQQVPGQVPGEVTNQVPGQVPQGTPIGVGGSVPQPTGQTAHPNSTLSAQATSFGAQTPGSGVLPGEPTQGTPGSALSAQHNVGESTTETAPAAFGSETGAPPEGELAHTGADGVGLLAGIAASLVAAGSGLVIAGRRREKDDEESSDTVE